MKIYIIPIEDKYYILPKKNPFCTHSPGVNVETLFNIFIHNRPEITLDPKEADWHYLPMYWSYWQLGHNYGLDGREEMKQYLENIIIDPKKTFTISEADNEPNFGIDIKVFSGNTKDNSWIPIPIITSPHQIFSIPEKKYLASFYGSLKTHPIRQLMARGLKGRTDVSIISSDKVQDETGFVNSILQSYAVLCPRGSALGSYRFYETMQLGRVPIMISDYDFRPFPNYFHWDEFSYFLDDMNKLPTLLDSLDKSELVKKGEVARFVWNVLFETWPTMVLETLKNESDTK